MSRPLRRVLTFATGVATALAAGPGFATVQAGVDQKFSEINHIVVIYEENHSFDNLYGNWPGVNGRANAMPANTTQVDQNGVAFGCLQQLDVNLASPPQPVTCTDALHGINSAFPNTYFTIDNYIGPNDTTCPQPHQEFSRPNGWAKGTGTPGGCTRDLVHEFYQEQYQLNGGQQNRYMSGSDSVGTTMGVYNSTALPIYAYLHQDGAPHYAIADDFFQSAFGGSFLNHQWLITAQTPEYPAPPSNLRSIIDSNGMPVNYPQYSATGPVRRGPITQACPSVVADRACGDYAVNTMQPPYQPSGTFGAKLVPQTHTTIGDELSAAGVSWAWYAGGWSNADGDVNAPGWTNGTTFGVCSDPRAAPNGSDATTGKWYCPDSTFQFHHQPFNYYVNYAPGTPGRAHLQDEQAFLGLAGASGKTCQLNSVSFIKPLGLENEHPGYASEPNGSDHLVDLLQSIENSACRKDTMVVVTYDEFGGQWDHVAPPGQGGTAGPHDLWGPGTRIPALIISPRLRGDFVVDHTQHDTTSILATIEHRYGLAALSTRDAAVNDLSSVFSAQAVET
jgi:acid phosphatase